MNWPLAASVVCSIWTLIQLANLFLNNRTRADVAELKLWITQERNKDRTEMERWVESNFVRKDVYEAARCTRAA